MKKSIRIMMITVAIVFSFILALGAFQGVSAAERKMKIKIPQCVCDTTDATVRSTVGYLDGVKSVDSNPANQSATIVFDDTKTSFEKIREALMGQGVTVLGKPDYQN